MQNYIKGTNRCQSYFSTLEDHVAADNAVRLMDAFIDKLDPIAIGIEKMEFAKTIHRSEGHPPYRKLSLIQGRLPNG
jgi:hypothetical protein